MKELNLNFWFSIAKKKLSSHLNAQSRKIQKHKKLFHTWAKDNSWYKFLQRTLTDRQSIQKFIYSKLDGANPLNGISQSQLCKPKKIIFCYKVEIVWWKGEV